MKLTQITDEHTIFTDSYFEATFIEMSSLLLCNHY